MSVRQRIARLEQLAPTAKLPKVVVALVPVAVADGMPREDTDRPRRFIAYDRAADSWRDCHADGKWATETVATEGAKN